MSTHTSKTRPSPIRVGDQFRTLSGMVWKVIETKPGGKLELFNEAGCYFSTRLYRDVREWERVS